MKALTALACNYPLFKHSFRSIHESHLFKLISNVWLYTNRYEPLLLCTQTIFCAEFCPRHLPV